MQRGQRVVVIQLETPWTKLEFTMAAGVALVARPSLRCHVRGNGLPPDDHEQPTSTEAQRAMR
jgi:hypothetical protein